MIGRVRSFILIAALLAGALPSLASAAVAIDMPIQIRQPGDAVYTFEVWARDLDGSDERLNAYTIAIDGAGFTPDGVRFVVPGSSFGVAGRPTEHPYVFQDMETIPPIENFGSTYNRLQFGATTIGQEDEVNINDLHNGFLKFSVFVPGNAPPGISPITVDPRALSLAGLGAPIVAVPGSPGGFFFPEPSAAALLMFPSLALLRRRRLSARAA